MKTTRKIMKETSKTASKILTKIPAKIAAKIATKVLQDSYKISKSRKSRALTYFSVSIVYRAGLSKFKSSLVSFWFGRRRWR